MNTVRNPGSNAAPRPVDALEALRIGWIAVQLGIVLLLARAFRLESPAFYEVILPLAFAGFLIHHWLPRRHQPLFFAGLSLAGIGLVFGVVGGAWLVGIGLGLIALCHVPIAFRWRVVLLVVAGLVLLAMRSTWLPAPWPGVIWPILGSMFMFRLAVYLYDLKHRGPASPGLVLSYFFLLPNSVFLLFPVIDFQTFRRTHYDKPALGIYEEGVRWVFRGLTHLVLYRLIYHYVVLSPESVGSTVDIVQYLVGNFALYLRVSGQFHIIVGMLHLFGFRLPETHRFFYLASSFSDLWRRINIYWKDFMQKMVYLPAIFRLRARGETTALVGATVIVVCVTWFLHSYQWFWLLGTWLFTATDIVFWGILGVLLVINTLREQKRGRDRQLATEAPRLGQALRHAVQTAGFFALMCVLWGFWTSPTPEDFAVVMGAATLRPIDVAAVLGTLGVVAAAAFLTRRFSMGVPSVLTIRPRWQHPLVVSALPLALFWVAGHPNLEGSVPAQVQAVSQQARLIELNEFDAERLQRGYYEQIVGVNRVNGELWELYARAGADAEVDPGPNRAAADAGVRGDQVQGEDQPGELETDRSGLKGLWVGDDTGLRSQLGANISTVFKGGRLSTNRWGMRDKDYEQTPPPGTRRIAILGPSYVFGSGVHDGETFEQIVEDRLNREMSRRLGVRFEVLNFAVPSYTLMQHAIILSNGRVGSFQPDVVIIAGHHTDFRVVADYVWKELQADRGFSAKVEQIVQRSGVTGDTPQAAAMARLLPFAKELTSDAMAEASAEIRRMGAEPVYAMIPMPGRMPPSDDSRLLMELAKSNGFLTVNIEDTFKGSDVSKLTLSAADRHPNAAGHQMIARRLYGELTQLPQVVAPDTDADAKRKATIRAEWSRENLARNKLAEENPAMRSNAGDAATAPIEGWTVDAPDGGQANLESSRTRNWMRVTISRLPASSRSPVTLRRTPVPVVKGHRYTLSFLVKADAARSVGCRVAQTGTSGQLVGKSATLEATSWWQEFTCAFTATAASPNAHLLFDLGTSDTPVEFSNVQFKNLTTGEVVMTTEPRQGRRGR